VEWTISRPKATWVHNDNDLRRVKEELYNHELIAFDTETTGLHPTEDHILFWSLATEQNRYFFERAHLESMRPLLEDPSKSWIGTHTKYDMHMMANAGIRMSGDWFCTLVMDRMADCDQAHGLKETYEREFNEQVLSFKDVFYPKNAKGQPMAPKGMSEQDLMFKVWNSKPQDLVEYASLDAWMSFRVFNVLQRRLEDMVSWRGQDLWDLYLELEEPFTKVLFKMERRGMYTDTGYLRDLIPKIEKRIDELKRELSKHVGSLINPNSPKQLAEYFFNKRGLEVIKLTPKGEPSVDTEVLDKLDRGGVIEAKIIKEVKQLDKTLSSFVTGLIDKVSPDGRIHSTFNQHVADTNRLTNQKPNLQQIPNPEKDPWGIRRAFSAPSGHVYLSGDYDQVELYIAAHYSGDPSLLDAIEKKRDLHAATAAFVWGEPYEDIVAAKKNKDADDERSVHLRRIRQFAKTVGFGLLYGKGPNLLAIELGFHEKVREEQPYLPENKIHWEAKSRAEALTERYFDRMPNVRGFVDWTHQYAADNKYVETWLGRRRWLRHVSDRAMTRAHQEEAAREALARNRDPRKAMCWCDICKESRAGERQSTNSPIQGTAADIVQKALNQMDADPSLSSVHLTLQVHDEAGWEVPKEIVHDAKARLQWHLENPGIQDLRVPLRAGLEAGPNWLEAK
jgi:DNA polymerase-1